MNARDIASVLFTRSCFRCGDEFKTINPRMRVCETCRRPRLNSPTIPGQKLTVRERQVIALVTQGLSNKLIASELHLSDGTIKAYLFRIFMKTGVTNRTELAISAIQKGISNEE